MPRFDSYSVVSVSDNDRFLVSDNSDGTATRNVLASAMKTYIVGVEKSVSVTLTSVQAQSLTSTNGVLIIPAPSDSTKAIVITGGWVIYQPSTISYNTSFQPYFYIGDSTTIAPSTNQLIAETSQLGTNTLVGDNGMINSSGAYASSNTGSILGNGVYITNQGTQLTNGDGTFLIKIAYKEI